MLAGAAQRQKTVKVIYSFAAFAVDSRFTLKHTHRVKIVKIYEDLEVLYIYIFFLTPYIITALSFLAVVTGRSTLPLCHESFTLLLETLPLHSPVTPYHGLIQLVHLWSQWAVVSRSSWFTVSSGVSLEQ